MKKIKPNKWFGYLLFFIPLIIYFIKPEREHDIYFLLAHGREVLTNGFPHTEFLSMHQNLHFIMQQWLSSITFYITYKLLGMIGLYFLVFIVLLLTIYLVYKLCMIISNNKRYVSCLITTIIIILYEMIFITPRPHIFTYLILIGLLIILELYLKKDKDKLYLIPILSVLLINIQASMWPVFFIFIMPFVAQLIIEKIKNKNNKINKLLIILLISIIVGIINPYGIENMIYGFISYGNSYINIIATEMHSINLSGEQKYFGYLLFLLFSLINILIIFNKNKKNKNEIHELLLIYGTFFMALLNFRNYGLFFIGALPFTTKYINIKDGNSKYIPKIIYILLIIILIGLIYISIKNKNYIIRHKCDQIIEYLNKNENKKIKIYTIYEDGNIFEFYKYKPYIDTRAEVFTKKVNKKEDILTEYYYFYYYPNKYFNKFDKKYKFDYYVIESNDEDLIKILENNKFKIVYKTNNRLLYKRDE